MREEFSYGIVLYSRFGETCKYLLLKRSEGWLDFPKGHIEKGENMVDAALRETREEAGVSLSPENLVPDFHYDITYYFTYRGTKIIKHVRMFLAEISPATNVKISSEHCGFIWLDYETAMQKLNFKNQRDLLEYARTYIEKLNNIEKLNSEYKEIYKNRKWDLSTNFVPGEGNLNASIFLVGQAPGKNEDIMKRPFVGRSGKLLESLLEEIKINREDVYITSVVQFFPPKNRAPTDEEIAICKPKLLKQIEIINPKIIVLLGSIAAKTMVPIQSIMKEHGALFDNKYFVTLHPAAALRNPENLKIMRSDFQLLRKIATGIL
ncbi:uracil-DNA glycosylase family protein [Ferroplasma sp.]|uniref:uracil-DNA glycosylase family protein n=1 Tax=Ferroplasma sp. TaxID=2591003 RepID=UPI00307E5E28